MRTVPHRPSVRHELFELPPFRWSKSGDVSLTPSGLSAPIGSTSEADAA
jgi:hypothetical protein